MDKNEKAVRDTFAAFQKASGEAKAAGFRVRVEGTPDVPELAINGGPERQPEPAKPAAKVQDGQKA